MSIVATVALADLAAVNAALEAQGFGPGNFSVPAYGATGATHAALHCWDSPAFLAALQALPAVTVTTGEDDPQGLTAAAIAAVGATWGAQVEPLPDSGTVTAGAIYRLGDDEPGLWSVIQTHSRSVYGGDPSQYPALMRRLRNPYVAEPWRQPIDQYDAYRLVNPFTGEPDEALHGGEHYVTDRDNNVWEPGTSDSGWRIKGTEPGGGETWVDTGATVAQLVGAGVYRVSADLSGVLSAGQSIKLGTAETTFTGFWAGQGTYLLISPHVTAAVGATVWAWA
jgi:hypothetical protein